MKFIAFIKINEPYSDTIYANIPFIVSADLLDKKYSIRCIPLSDIKGDSCTIGVLEFLIPGTIDNINVGNHIQAYIGKDNIGYFIIKEIIEDENV